MKNAFFFAVALTMFTAVSCKKNSGDDDDENCSRTTAAVKFENRSSNPLRVDVSKANETNSDFTAADITFELAANSTVEKDMPTGVRFIRWTFCPPRQSCGKVNLSVADYDPCEKYTEYSGPLAASDLRYKKNLSELQASLVTEKLMELNPMAYEYDFSKFPTLKAPHGATYGFIAQDLEKVFPETVVRDAEGYRSVNYIALIPVLTAVIQRQQQEIRSLSGQVDRIVRQQK